MIFSSNIFLFTFLPIFLTVYYLAPNRFKNLVILLASYSFYAWWRPDFLLLFVFVTLFNYKIGLLIDFYKKRFVSGVAWHWVWLVIGVTGNLAVLGYFKYMNFGVESFNTLLSYLGAHTITSMQIILPIGISFYIFQSISYIVDVYRGHAPVTKNVIDFAAFVALFPQLIAGPVLRYKDLANQFVAREHSLSKFGEGCTWFMIGFVKKVFLADSIAPVVDSAFSGALLSFSDAWIGALAYSLQLYFDFSGYSDMAIGLGLMIGFRFINNFDNPYISQSITEFWRRWHISLSSWLRDYLYIPLGGNRKGKLKTYRNLFLTMLLGGVWHGANWTFVLWGAWHGMWLAIEKRFGLGHRAGFSVVSWLLTLFLVVLGWVMFRAESIGDAFVVYRAMFGWSSSDAQNASLTLQGAQITFLFVGIFCAVLAPHLKRLLLARAQMGVHIIQLGLLPVFVLSILKLSAQSYSPFLYFQF